jgi:hypothetical protein
VIRRKCQIDVEETIMKAMGPGYERETIIRFDDDGDVAELWTASATYYRRMLKRGFVPKEDGERHALFEFPKGSVKLPRFGKSKRGFASRKVVVENGTNPSTR